MFRALQTSPAREPIAARAVSDEGARGQHPAQRPALAQRPVIAWLTGLSGAGKSTIAAAVADRLATRGYRAIVLDGDALRRGLSCDLGYGEADRAESVRRAAEVARLMAETGLIVIVALISPYRANRTAARRIAGPIPFLEVFVDTPHIVCEWRDPKGLYARARTGQVAQFTGLTAPYETPITPDMHLTTHGWTVEQSAAPLVARLARLGAA